jgi:YD repeat-containing protein
MQRTLLASLLFVLCAIPGSVQSAQGEQKSAEINLQTMGKAPAALKNAEGELSRVDGEKQLLWIKSADGKELQFSYDKQTKVTGGDSTVEGLAKMSGSHLRVQYEAVAGANRAASIEILPGRG